MKAKLILSLAAVSLLLASCCHHHHGAHAFKGGGYGYHGGYGAPHHFRGR